MTTDLNNVSNSSPENIVAVPNRTPLTAVNEPLVPYIERYKQFAKAGAEGIIDQCRTLVLAEDELSPKNFTRFCEELKVSTVSSTFRKLKKIGEEADRLKSAGDQVPNSWTTLYHLAKMEREVFDRVLTSGQLHPAMTAQELNFAVSGQKDISVHYIVRIDLDKVTDGIRVEALTKMKEWAASYGVKIDASKPLDALVREWKQQADKSALQTAA
jgi:hypothetical protein